MISDSIASRNSRRSDGNPQLPDRPDLLAKSRRHKRRIANQAGCGVAPGDQPAEIPRPGVLGEEPGKTVVQGKDEGTSRIGEIDQVIVSVEDFEAQVRFDFPYLSAERGLHNMNTIRCLAEVQFACDSQDVFQFTEWGSGTHDITASKWNWAAGAAEASRMPSPRETADSEDLNLDDRTFVNPLKLPKPFRVLPC